MVGRPVWRTLTGECLLLNEDLKTPPESLKLEEGEADHVDSGGEPGVRAFAGLSRRRGHVPGAPFDAGFAREPGRPFGGGGRTDAVSRIEHHQRDRPVPRSALGNRLGSAAVWAAAKNPALQENVIGISVKPEEKHKAMALWDILQATNYRQIGIEKLGPPTKKQQAPIGVQFRGQLR